MTPSPKDPVTRLWPDCPASGPITTQAVAVVGFNPTGCGQVVLHVAAGSDPTMAITVPRSVRGLGIAESSWLTGEIIWMTSLVSKRRRIPVLFHAAQGHRP